VRQPDAAMIASNIESHIDQGMPLRCGKDFSGSHKATSRLRDVMSSLRKACGASPYLTSVVSRFLLHRLLRCLFARSQFPL
jgi:hypothetical protein